MGFFITFEGIEGCGKTTQVRLLAEALNSRFDTIVTTREPGGCPISDKIRAILLDAANAGMAPVTELLLYAAARSQHLHDVVKPALSQGALVLCDRFSDATIAYQGHGRGLDLSMIKALNVIAADNLSPDLTLLFDCDIETGLARAKSRIDGATGPREERFELEAIEFHRRVQRGYRSLATEHADRFIIIDAEQSIEIVQQQVLKAVLHRLSTIFPSAE